MEITETKTGKKKKLYAYLRKYRANHDILKAVDKDTGRELIISVSPDGELYDKKGAYIDKAKSKRYWLKLFEFALDDKYGIVPKGFLK